MYSLNKLVLEGERANIFIVTINSLALHIINIVCLISKTI